MPSPDQILTAYQTQVGRVREQTVKTGLAIWNGLPDYRDGNIDRFIVQIVPRVRAGQIKTAQLTAAFVKQSAKARGEDVPMALVDREQIAAVRKIDPVVEYRRPAVTLYTALRDGLTLAAGVELGAKRLTDLMSTDMQLAKTTQAQKSMQAAGYEYYVRVLTGLENCALCSIASTQRYHVKDLMPIHPGCDCGADTVNANFDPGHILDPQFLEETHAHVEQFVGGSDRGGRSPDYRELIITRENGEWGPTLTWLSDRFTGPIAA